MQRNYDIDNGNFITNKPLFISRQISQHTCIPVQVSVQVQVQVIEFVV